MHCITLCCNSLSQALEERPVLFDSDQKQIKCNADTMPTKWLLETYPCFELVFEVSIPR